MRPTTSPGIRYSAAVGLESERTGTQRLHVVAEVRGDGLTPEELSRIALDVTQAVRQRNGLRPARVLLVKPQTIPKTSSGKIQRAALAAMVAEGASRTGSSTTPERPGTSRTRFPTAGDRARRLRPRGRAGRSRRSGSTTAWWDSGTRSAAPGRRSTFS